MRVILSAAGRAFLRAFLVSFLMLVSGFWLAPNLSEAYALAGAASIASLIAGLRALLVFVPGISKAIAAAIGVPLAFAEVAVTLLTAFLGGSISLLVDVLSAPDLNTARSVGLAGLIALGAALTRIVQAVFTPGEAPAVGGGIAVPPQPVPPAALPEPIQP